MEQTCQNGEKSDNLFDVQLLHNLDFSKCSGTYQPSITPRNPGENLMMRPLNLNDYDKGYMQLLAQLTVVGDVSREEFEAKFEKMRACPNTFYIVVLEDTSSNQVIGSASLIIEHKFIHQCATRGRVEDVVVNNAYRGKQLGKLLLDVLTLLSQEVGCYKISLECKDKLVSFYKQFGYINEEGQNYMCRRFWIESRI